MFSYIKSDFYRLRHKKQLYGVAGVFIVLFSLLMMMINGNITTGDEYVMFIQIIIQMIPVFVGSYLFSIVYNDDLKSKAHLTAIGFGKTRTEIVLVKLIDYTILSVFVILVMFIFLLGAPLFLGIALSQELIRSIFFMLISGLIRCIGFAALASVATFTFQKATFSIIAYVMLATDTVRGILNLILSQGFIVNIVGNLTPYLFSNYAYNSYPYLLTGFGNGFEIFGGIALYIIIPTILAIIIFKKKELEF